MMILRIVVLVIGVVIPLPLLLWVTLPTLLLTACTLGGILTSWQLSLHCFFIQMTVILGWIGLIALWKAIIELGRQSRQMSWLQLFGISGGILATIGAAAIVLLGFTGLSEYALLALIGPLLAAVFCFSILRPPWHMFNDAAKAHLPPRA